LIYVCQLENEQKNEKQPQRYLTLFTLTINKIVSQTIGTLSTLSVIFYHFLTTFFPQQEWKNFKLGLPLIKWSPIPVFERKSHCCHPFPLRSSQETINQFFLPDMESGSKNFKMENESQMAPYKDYFRLGENYSA
jgi:hypothetical protein